MTVVDFPCAIACDTTYAVYACRFITAYFPRDNMCYVTANEIPRAHGKSTTHVHVLEAQAQSADVMSHD